MLAPANEAFPPQSVPTREQSWSRSVGAHGNSRLLRRLLLAWDPTRSLCSDIFFVFALDSQGKWPFHILGHVVVLFTLLAPLIFLFFFYVVLNVSIRCWQPCWENRLL